MPLTRSCSHRLPPNHDYSRKWGIGPTLQSLDDQGRSGGDDGDGGLSVLDGELDSDSETLPVAGSLGNVFSDLLGGLGLGVSAVPC